MCGEQWEDEGVEGRLHGDDDGVVIERVERVDVFSSGVVAAVFLIVLRRTDWLLIARGDYVPVRRGDRIAIGLA